MGGPCDRCVSPSPNIFFLFLIRLGLGLIRQGQDLGSVGTGDCGLGLGLDNNSVFTRAMIPETPK